MSIEHKLALPVLPMCMLGMRLIVPSANVPMHVCAAYCIALMLPKLSQGLPSNKIVSTALGQP